MKKELIEQMEEILELEAGMLKEEDNFRDFDNWYSMANLAVIAMLDDAFGVNIETERFRELKTVSDLIEEVKSRMV